MFASTSIFRASPGPLVHYLPSAASHARWYVGWLGCVKAIDRLVNCGEELALTEIDYWQCVESTAPLCRFRVGYMHFS